MAKELMREEGNQDRYEQKRAEVEEDIRHLRQEFKHYLREYWLYKNADNGQIHDEIAYGLGQAAGF